MNRAKVIKNGHSQSILLPENFHVDADQVSIKKTDEGFLVLTKDPWESFYEGVDELSDEFMSDGRQQPAVELRN